MLRLHHLSKFSSPDDAQNTYKYLKNEGIGKNFRIFYSAWASFEESQGNTNKSLDVIRKGRHCEKPSPSLVEQDDNFKLFLHHASRCASCQRQRTASAAEQASATPFGTTPAKRFKPDASKLFSTAKKNRNRLRRLESGRLGV